MGLFGWTTSSVDWSNVENWSSGQLYQTPDISAIIQEIVDRPGWSSGNALVIMIRSEGGDRDAISYDSSASDAALLHVDGTAGSYAVHWLEYP